MAWHKILVTGLVASVAIVGCTVTTGTDTGDSGLTNKDSGAGGAKNTAGASGAGGKSTGGAGGASSGGAKSTGGANAGGAKSDAGDAGAEPDSGCTICLKAKCLTSYNDCGFDDACAQSNVQDGEFLKIQLCMFDVTGDASVAIFTAADLTDCASNNAKSGGVPSMATDALLQCMHGSDDASTQPCTVECFGAEVPFQ
jgi:hypothetical protein